MGKDSCGTLQAESGKQKVEKAPVDAGRRKHPITCLLDDGVHTPVGAKDSND
jgi:hypothetical protein